MFLKKIQYTGKRADQFPLTMPLFHQPFTLELTAPVTIIVGENGSGKSTVLEAIAMAAEAIHISNNQADYQKYDELLPYLKLIWTIKNRRGFFFRADTFDTFIQQIMEQKTFAKGELKRIEAENPTSLERIPYLNTLAELDQLYPIPFEELSHGQSFLELFKSRLRPNSMYVLDEPESPLTPQNQMSLLLLIDEYVKQGSQFIIATHSPIIMAMPKANILEIQENILQEVDYHDIEHVRFMKHFMDDPKLFMHHLFNEN